MRKPWVWGLVIVLVLAVFSFRVHADTNSSNFESPTFVLGSINGQNGWRSASSVDQAIVANPTGFSSFAAQSFRISNAFVGDQVYSPALSEPVGESLAVGDTPISCSSIVRQTHLELQFDLASASPAAEQPGLSVVVAPVGADGSPMSYLRFDDAFSGINVFIKDYDFFSSGFRERQPGVALNRSVPHTLKLVMDTPEGPHNDTVRLFIDNRFAFSLNSWEDYYWFNPDNLANPFPRLVKFVYLQPSGSASAATANAGFIFDNFSLTSSVPGSSTTPTPLPPPTNKEQCKNGGWQAFCGPTFKNQGDCVSFVEHLK